MAALAKDRHVPTNNGGYRARYTVIASDIIYKGAFVSENGSGDVGPTVAVAATCTGIALEQQDNSAGAAAAKTVEVLVGGIIMHAVASATKANINDLCYASDDQTLVLTSTSNQQVGRIIGFDPNESLPIIQMNTPGGAV